MAKTVKAKVSVKATAKVKATGEIASKIAKVNSGHAKDQTKQVEQATAFWATLERVAQGKKISAELATATRSNGQARRQWCLDNKAVMIDVSTIATKNGSGRPENTLRAKLLVLTEHKTVASKIGYVRVLDSQTATMNPDHDLADMVFIYRQK